MKPQAPAGLFRARKPRLLYDESLRLLARRGLPIPGSHIQRDWTQAYVENDAVEGAWLTVYRDPKHYWDLYQLGEELTDLGMSSARQSVQPLAAA